MNSEEFYKEVKASELCPANFDEIIGEFRGYQKLAIDTLKEFHRVCEKNGVSYQLAYGTLLGAVRDGGQIPWDYDVDVFVPYAEKQKLIEALEADLGEDYYYYCPEKDPKCRHVIMRVTPKGFRSEALHVDVFFLIGLPSDEAERKRFTDKVAELSRARYDKLIRIGEESRGSLKRFAKLALHRIRAAFRSVSSMQKRYNELCAKYPYDQAEFVGDASIFIKRIQPPAEYVRETVLYKTEEGEFRIPAEYDKLLTWIYKDYRRAPSLESRVKEMMSHYSAIKEYERDRK